MTEQLFFYSAKSFFRNISRISSSYRLLRFCFFFFPLNICKLNFTWCTLWWDQFMENSTLFALLQMSQIVVTLCQKYDSDIGDFSNPRKSNIYPHLSKRCFFLDISLKTDYIQIFFFFKLYQDQLLISEVRIWASYWKQ